jgi:hypothetical protein
VVLGWVRITFVPEGQAFDLKKFVSWNRKEIPVTKLVNKGQDV